MREVMQRIDAEVARLRDRRESSPPPRVNPATAAEVRAWLAAHTPPPDLREPLDPAWKRAYREPETRFELRREQGFR